MVCVEMFNQVIMFSLFDNTFSCNVKQLFNFTINHNKIGQHNYKIYTEAVHDNIIIYAILAYLNSNLAVRIKKQIVIVKL